MSAANDDFTASERADMALLRSAGVISSDTRETGQRHTAPTASTTMAENGLNAQERADMAFLRAAGVIKPADAA